MKYPDQTRNLNPHAEARVARVLWNEDYAAQRGGCMDFWGTLGDAQKRQCREIVDQILESPRAKP